MFFLALGDERDERDAQLLILHGCTKQAPGTPPADAALARERQEDYRKRSDRSAGAEPMTLPEPIDDLDRYLDARTSRDAAFGSRWERGSGELAFRTAIIEARLTTGLTQGELAHRMGTRESLVTRLEVGAARPRLDALRKVAGALPVTFEIDGAGIRVREQA
jgi:ribosome-binding protein aMBF1 (putative translation factor)